MSKASHQGGADITIDQEQIKKYEEIIELLLAAGYFRARISALSQFDKIVGGLAWCVTASNVDLDIDLFFEEDAQIRQKIELGEQIEKALVKMKCPFQLFSYQIRGLDTEKLFPVIQWLVKKVIETRKETGDLLRLYSESQFKKNYQSQKFPDDKEFNASFVEEVAAVYLPQRRFRRTKAKPKDAESHVLSTLLEYGYRGLKGTAQDEEEEKEEGSQIQQGRKLFKEVERDRKKEAEEKAKAEEDRLNNFMKSMEAAVEGDVASRLGDLMGGDADLIREIATKYARQSDHMDEKQLQKYFGVELHKRQTESRKKQIESENQKLAELRAEHDELEEQYEELLATYNKKVAFNKRIEEEIQKLNALETPENTHLLQALRGLVALNENLKNQESMFRNNCKKQMEELQANIDRLKADNPTDEDEIQTRHKLIQEAHVAEASKIKQGKALLAKKNREIALVERKIDEVPSRAELQQYQRQFIELYEAVSSKFIETRKYFNSYNILNDTKGFLEKEVSILNSIESNYKAAMSTKENREKFSQSLQQIIQGVKQNLEKVEGKLGEERAKKDRLESEYQAGVEKERQYYNMTKNFLLECAKNEKLLAENEEN